VGLSKQQRELGSWVLLKLPRPVPVMEASQASASDAVVSCVLSEQPRRGLPGPVRPAGEVEGLAGRGSRGPSSQLRGHQVTPAQNRRGCRQGENAPKLCRVIGQYQSCLVSIGRAQLKIERCKKLVTSVCYRKSNMFYSQE